MSEVTVTQSSAISLIGRKVLLNIRPSGFQEETISGKLTRVEIAENIGVGPRNAFVVFAFVLEDKGTERKIPIDLIHNLYQR